MLLMRTRKSVPARVLVQLYTALAFRGPMLVSEVKQGIAELLELNGFKSIRDAVGTTSAGWIASVPQSTEVQTRSKAGIIPSAKRRRLSREPWPLSST